MKYSDGEDDNKCSKTKTKIERWKHYYYTLLEDYNKLERSNDKLEQQYEDLKHDYYKLKDKFHKYKNNDRNKNTKVTLDPTTQPTPNPISITNFTIVEELPSTTTVSTTTYIAPIVTNTPITSATMHTNVPIETNTNSQQTDVSVLEMILPEMMEEIDNNVNSIVCNDDSICSEKTITCNNEHKCIINCESFQSCFLTTFKCMNGYDCYINCIGYKSCKESKIIADYSNNLEVICNGKQSCDNIKIQCPIYGENNCKILSIHSVNRIDIWAVNSWMNINDLSYLPINTVIGMNCGARDNLLNNCEMIIDNNNKNKWNCDNKISECYIDNNYNVQGNDSYSQMSTLHANQPLHNHNDTNIMIANYNENINEPYTHGDSESVGIVISCILFLLLLLVVACRFWYHTRKVNNMTFKRVKNIITKKNKITNDKKSVIIDYDDDNAIVELHPNVGEWRYP